MIDEFFELYYGAAGPAMQELYAAIEGVYTGPDNYAGLRGIYVGYQTEDIAWGALGTPERMEEAKAAAETPMEKKRVGLFEESVWLRMKSARDEYMQKLSVREEEPGIEGANLPAENWGRWEFRKDEENLGVEEKWYADHEDGREWTPVEVPAFLSETAVGHYLGYGWYRTTFEIPEELRGAVFRPGGLTTGRENNGLILDAARPRFRVMLTAHGGNLLYDS